MADNTMSEALLGKKLRIDRGALDKDAYIGTVVAVVSYTGGIHVYVKSDESGRIWPEPLVGCKLLDSP